VFDRNFRFLLNIGSQQGQENGQFCRPRGVTVDQRNNQIVVTDTSNHRIQIFVEKGGFLRVFGSEGKGDGQFSSPHDIVDQQGNYVVVEQGNHRVQIFNSQGQFFRKFGSNGTKNGQIQSPWGVGLLSNGNIVVSEHSGNRLQIFDFQGNFVRIVGAGQVTHPCHLFVDSDDNILVADLGNSRIQVFHQNGNYTKTIGTGSFQALLVFAWIMREELLSATLEPMAFPSFRFFRFFDSLLLILIVIKI